MVSDMKHQIDGHKFCEPDYGQILLWAEVTRQTPTEVVERLVDCKSIFRQGRLAEIYWDDSALRVQKFRFVPGLKIEVFHVLGASRLEAIIHMMRSSSLRRSDGEVHELDLAGLGDLEELAVPSQRLRELDLRPVPKLKRLFCDVNLLCSLDASGCGSLEEMVVRANLLTELHLPHSPSLKSIHCHQNELKVLDLTGTPAVEELDCRENQLDVLNISPLENLKLLKFDGGRTRLIQRPDQHF